MIYYTVKVSWTTQDYWYGIDVAACQYVDISSVKNENDKTRNVKTETSGHQSLKILVP